MMNIDVGRTENEAVGDGEIGKKHTVNTVLFKKKSNPKIHMFYQYTREYTRERRLTLCTSSCIAPLPAPGAKPRPLFV